MKRIVMGLVLATLLTGSAAIASAATPRVDRREVRQHDRIHQGVQSGQLTPRESMRLQRGQVRVHRMEQRAKADGLVTQRERVRLNRMENRQSRHIYRLKHNGRTL